MGEEKNGNGVNRRLDVGSKFITGSITFAIALFMFFLGVFCNSLSGKVDFITAKSYANENEITGVKKDYDNLKTILDEIKSDIKEIKKSVN